MASHVNFKFLLVPNLSTVRAQALCRKGGATTGSRRQIPALVRGDPAIMAVSCIAPKQLWSSTQQTVPLWKPSFPIFGVLRTERAGFRPVEALRSYTVRAFSLAVKGPPFEGGTEQGRMSEPHWEDIPVPLSPTSFL